MILAFVGCYHGRDPSLTCDAHRRLFGEYGLLFLDDEVFTGVARSGKFWAIEHSAVKPDMISAGKSLAGGVSYSAIIGRSEIMDSWGPGGWCGTHMGNHLGAAAALASLEVVENEGLAAKAAELGKYFLKGLQDLQDEHELIGDVNGRGLFLGLELVKDRRTKERAYEEAGKIQYEAQKRGLLVRAAFNRIAPSPPLTIGKERIDMALEILGEAIREVERTVPRV
jgi:4-aminobutyrate aminotransferase